MRGCATMSNGRSYTESLHGNRFDGVDSGLGRRRHCLGDPDSPGRHSCARRGAGAPTCRGWLAAPLVIGPRPKPTATPGSVTANYVQFMVVGVDGPAFGSSDGDELHEAHWAYIEDWSEALVARGPTVTADGERHTGSVHVVNLPTAADAQRFALDEPYARAGWYSEVSVAPVLACTHGTMWDVDPREHDGVSSLVRTGLGDASDARDVVESLRRGLSNTDQPWIYLGVTSADRGDEHPGAIGIVGLVDLAPAESERALQDLLRAAVRDDAVGIVCHRWRRGGRPST